MVVLDEIGTRRTVQPCAIGTFGSRHLEAGRLRADHDQRVADGGRRVGRRERLGVCDRLGEADDRPVVVGAGLRRHRAEAGIGGIRRQLKPLRSRRLLAEVALGAWRAVVLEEKMAGGQHLIVGEVERAGGDVRRRLEAADMAGDFADARDLGRRETERRAEVEDRPAVVGAVDDVDGDGG